MEEDELQQRVVEEQSRPIFTSRPMENKKLQQPVNNGEFFFQ
jgi:hypothetical protein